MTSSLLSRDWKLFVSFVHSHEKDLRSFAGHIVNVGQRISAVVEEIISTDFGKIKEIFIDTLEFIKRCALPSAIVSASFALGWAVSSYEQGFGLFIAGCTIAYACSMAKNAGTEVINESKVIEKVGLSKARDVIENLLQQIEDKKLWEEDNSRTTKPYIDHERKIKNFKKEIDALIIPTLAP